MDRGVETLRRLKEGQRRSDRAVVGGASHYFVGSIGELLAAVHHELEQREQNLRRFLGRQRHERLRQFLGRQVDVAPFAKAQRGVGVGELGVLRLKAGLPVGELTCVHQRAQGHGSGSGKVADQVDVAKGVEAEGRDELVDGIPDALLKGGIAFTPVALDRVDVASLDVEVDDVGSRAAVGQEGIDAFKIEVAVRLADREALAFKGQVEALGPRNGLGDLIGLKGFFGVVLVRLDEGPAVHEVLHLARREFHHLGVLFGVLEVGRGRIDIEVFGVNDGRVRRASDDVPAGLADADAHEADAEQVALQIGVEAGHLIHKLVVHVGLDAGGSLFAGRVGVAKDAGTDRATRRPEFLNGLGLELDYVLDEQGMDRRAGPIDLSVAFALGVQAKELNALLDLLFPLLTGVLEGGIDVLTLGADVVDDGLIQHGNEVGPEGHVDLDHFLFGNDNEGFLRELKFEFGAVVGRHRVIGHWSLGSSSYGRACAGWRGRAC